MENYRSRSANDIYATMSIPTNYSQFTGNDHEFNHINFEYGINPYITSPLNNGFNCNYFSDKIFLLIIFY